MAHTINAYLASVASPMHRAKARAALETQVRVNDGPFMFRHELVENRLAAGARVMDQRGEMVLMNSDGSFLRAKSITKHGLNYAAWLSVHEVA